MRADAITALTLATLISLCLALPVNEKQPSLSAPSISVAQSASSEYVSSVPSQETGPASPSSDEELKPSNPAAKKHTVATTSRRRSALRHQSSISVKTLKRELAAFNLGPKSTASGIEEKISNLMKKYEAHYANVLFDYLKRKRVKQEVIALIRDARIRESNRLSKQRERKGTSRRSYRMLRRGRGIAEVSSESEARRRQKAREMRTREQALQLQHFRDQLDKAGLHYDMDPVTYAKKEVPLRQKINTYSYGYFQKLLQRHLDIDQDWRDKYQRTIKLLSNRRSFRRRKLAAAQRMSPANDVTGQQKRSSGGRKRKYSVDSNSAAETTNDATDVTHLQLDVSTSQSIKALQGGKTPSHRTSSKLLASFPLSSWSSRQKRSPRSQKAVPVSAHSDFPPQAFKGLHPTTEYYSKGRHSVYGLTKPSPLDAPSPHTAILSSSEEETKEARPTVALKRFRGGPVRQVATIRPVAVPTGLTPKS